LKDRNNIEEEEEKGGRRGRKEEKEKKNKKEEGEETVGLSVSSNKHSQTGHDVAVYNSSCDYIL
jgi:hypothetical protein